MNAVIAELKALVKALREDLKDARRDYVNAAKQVARLETERDAAFERAYHLAAENAELKEQRGKKEGA